MHPPSTPALRERLSQNRKRIRERIRRAALAAGRDPKSVRLLPVTKAVGLDSVHALLALGERDFGENRAQALSERAREVAGLGYHPRWHFIGPLQRNKARRVCEVADVIHSVHSIALLETLARITEELQRPMEIYLQVGLTGEAQKQGLDPEALPGALSVLRQSPHLRGLGLMTMGPQNDPDLQRTDKIFATLSELGRTFFGPTAADAASAVGPLGAHPAQRPRPCQLSMGMSNDLECAIAHGSTLVRVGSDLFV